MKRFSGIPFAGDEFREVLGHCIAQWSEIETEVFSICHAAMGTNHTIAAIVYYRTPTLRNRLDLASELTRAMFPVKEPGAHDPKLLERWDGRDGLFRRIEAELSFRNRIVHDPIQKVPSKESVQMENGASLEFYTPQSSQAANEIARGKSIKAPLLLNDLKDHFWRCDQLIDELQDFRLSFTTYAHERRR